VARFMRAHFEGKQYEWCLSVDLTVGNNLKWIERVRTAGWWGRVDDDQVWPFMLKPGGEIDFGGDKETPVPPEIRYASIDLSGRELKLGELFWVVCEGKRYRFVLRSLKDITELVT